MERKKPGPKTLGKDRVRRRSVSMTDVHWSALEAAAKLRGLRSASSLVCKWIESQAIYARISSGQGEEILDECSATD
jgi:hypothetical protein